MDLSKFKGSNEHEEACFQKLLCAIYGRPYQLESADELVTMTDMARYYQALPVVSPTVYAATLKTPDFYLSIMKNPCSALTSAKTLRNDLLFKDSLLLCLGPWSKPAFLKLSDPELIKISAAAHTRICAKVVKAQPLLLMANVRHRPIEPWGHYNVKDVTVQYQELGVKLLKLAESCKEGYGNDRVLLPTYYRKYSQVVLNSDSLVSEIREVIAPLLVNKLKMASGLFAGDGEFKDHFLCKSCP
jgi:hypothetical protein